MVETNKHQTQLTDKFLDSLDKEVREQLMGYIDNIQFIKNLISPNRKYSRDCERDERGRIIVDLINPHIVENTDYFRPAALHFKEHGCYTKLRPNSNPNSQYGMWLKEELNRIWNGYVRPEDGEWVPGELYFYLNYCPIEQAVVDEKSNKNVAERIVDFPLFWEAMYIWFHYLHQGRYGGKYNDFKGGNHGIIIAKRGVGKAHPYSQEVMTPEGLKYWSSIKKGDKLFTDDNSVTTVTDIPFDDIAQIYKVKFDDDRYVKCTDGHLWDVIIDWTSSDANYRSKTLPTSELYKLLKDNKRVYVVGNNGYELPKKPFTLDPFTYGNSLRWTDLQSNTKSIDYILSLFNEYIDNSKEVRERVLDGFFMYGRESQNNGKYRSVLYSSKLVKFIQEICFSLGYYCIVKEEIPKKLITNYENYNTVEYDIIIDKTKRPVEIRKIEFCGKEQCKCVEVDNPTGRYLIGKSITTHNSYSSASILARIFVCGESEKVWKQVRGLITAYEGEYLTKDGTLNKFINFIDFIAENTQFPSERIKNSLAAMHWMMGYQDKVSGVTKGTKNEVIGFSSKDNPDKGRGKRSVKLIFEEFGRFPQFITTWNTLRWNTEDNGFAFGQNIGIGTGGTEGNDFSGALEIIYNPLGYNVYGVPNVFDKNSQGKQKSVFFVGCYMNAKGFFDKNGISDVIGALIREITERLKIKYNSSDPNTLTQRMAENPVTIQECIMKKDSNMYPVADLQAIAADLEINNKVNELFIGVLDMNRDGEVTFRPDKDVNVITQFPHNDNKMEGAIAITELPQKDSNGVVYTDRYIAGIDPFDDDHSETLSLGTIYILDLWTDRIVFEYAGRPQFANDFYEICRRALLMYDARANYENNKKGLFGHFSKCNCIYLLTEELQFLSDKDVVRESYGNKKYGTNALDGNKKYGRRALRDYLLKEVTLDTYNSEIGITDTVTVRNLTFVKYLALLKELMIWNPDGNFDRHDAMVMLMLLREDRLRTMKGEDPSSMRKKSEKDDLANDDYFVKNYDDKVRRLESKSAFNWK